MVAPELAAERAGAQAPLRLALMPQAVQRLAVLELEGRALGQAPQGLPSVSAPEAQSSADESRPQGPPPASQAHAMAELEDAEESAQWAVLPLLFSA